MIHDKHLLLFIIITISLLGLICLVNYYYTPLESFQNKTETVITPPFNRCYVINLKETKEGILRWKVMEKHPVLKSYVNQFPGIYGKEYDFKDAIANNIIYPRWDYGTWQNKASKVVEMDPGELGCILSHRNVWKKIVDEGIGVTLVLEDDAVKVKKDFIKTVSEIQRHVPGDWDIILLGFWLHRGNNGSKVNPHIHRVKNFCLLHSYLLSLKGAKRLLSLGTINKPLDTWMSYQSDKLKIYRHNKVIGDSKFPASAIIGQLRREKQIKNTNNW